ncbi:methyltransferase [Spongiibacter taiwanensis]
MPSITPAQAHQIDTLLLRHQALWRSHSYGIHCPDWLPDHPELTHRLLSLSDQVVQQLQADDSALLATAADCFADAQQIQDIIQPFQWRDAPLPSEEPPSGIPGRKWQQIRHFLGRARYLEKNTEQKSNTIIEWCSGKAHLGRAAHSLTGQPVLGLEIDPDLVAAANRHYEGTGITVAQCDVLSDAVRQYLTPPPTTILALHACGGLHQRLLTSTSEQQCPHIVLAPCCYHRFNAGYRALSCPLRDSNLQLENHDLRSAVRQSCTARAGEIHQRRELQAGQLAFRVLLQDNGLDPAMPLPSLKHPGRSKVQEGDDLAGLFDTYAQRKDITPRLRRAQEDYRALGQSLLARAERLELARMLFRRLLELRCVFDSALYLQERGYQCAVEAFCPPGLSPRNLLISATKSP